MRTRLTRNSRIHPSPTTPGLLAQTDLACGGSSRLRAKVLLFKDTRHLRLWWNRNLPSKLCTRTLAAVNTLSRQTIAIRPGQPDLHTNHVHPRYFCLVALAATHCSMLVLSHEAVHVGYAYARRIRKAPWDHIALHMDEEAVAYPAGEFARNVTLWLRSVGALPQ